LNTTPQAILQPSHYFSSVIYTINKPEFLDAAKTVSEDALNATKQTQDINAVYPSVMSPFIANDVRIKDLVDFIAQSGWIILDSQGYDVDHLGAFVSEMWAQEHLKYSGMEQHVHTGDVVLSGFYFLDTPEGGQMIELHDPRAGKVQASLKLKDPTRVKEANNSLFIKPESGMFVFSNSWLPHSFTRNTSDNPCRFIHFNIAVKPITQTQKNSPIIV